MTFREQLQDILSGPLYERLADMPGWSVEIAATSAAWQEDDDVASSPDGTSCSWHARHPSGLHATVTLKRQGIAPAATVQVTIQNPTPASVVIVAIRPLDLRWEGIPSDVVEFRSLAGGNMLAFYPPPAYRETVLAKRRGMSEALRIGSDSDGRSSNQSLPLLQMTLTGATPGGVIVGMEWSGGWWQSIGPAYAEQADTQQITWEVGIPVHDLLLHPGESLTLPAVHLIAFTGDRDAGGNACRRYVYAQHGPLLDGQRPLPPISYDHWYGIGNALDEAVLQRQIPQAAALGVEYFVVDAGWYAGSPHGQDFGLGTGNWETPDPAKFPRGLEPLVEEVCAHGMQFGLWFDVERAHRDSHLAREHPEWFIDIGAPYLHLNLALIEAQEYVIRLISTWIERLGLAWTRWDYNINPKPYWDHADPTGKIQFAYTAGLYHVLDTLMLRYPQWVIECCAGGGRRLDLGTLRRAHTAWFSDSTEDALVCHFIKAGANRFLPGHLLNSGLTVPIDGDVQPITDVDVLSRMAGAFNLGGDIARWSPEVVTLVTTWIARYRSFRHVLVGDFYPLTPQPTRPEEYEVIQFAVEGDAMIFGFSGVTPKQDVVVFPRALEADATYCVSDLVHEQITVIQGHDLQAQGIILSLVTGVALYRLQRISIMPNGA